MLLFRGTREFVAVLEFVPGAVLQGLEGQRHAAKGAPVLEQLGQLVGLDCVLNNVDRVPAIWCGAAQIAATSKFVNPKMTKTHGCAR